MSRGGKRPGAGRPKSGSLKVVSSVSLSPDVARVGRSVANQEGKSFSRWVEDLIVGRIKMLVVRPPGS